MFQYDAVDAHGVRRKGRLAADSVPVAFQRVAALGLTPVHIRQVALESHSGARASALDLAQVTYELSVILKAGIPISEGLRGIAEHERKESLRRVISDLADRIASGQSISDSLRAHEHIFGAVYVRTIAAAESSGTLVRAMEHLSETLEADAETRRRVSQALAYPIIVGAALTAATTFLLAFVVPRFASMFEQRGVDLPILTRILTSVGSFMREYWWGILGAVVVAAFILRSLWRSKSARTAIDRALHSVPLIRPLLVSLAVARFARVLGISLSSGVSLIDGLRQAGAASGRPTLEADAHALASRIERGSSLIEAMDTTDYLPTFARRMLAAGESSAELPRMCDVVARHYDRESTHITKNLGTAIEPLLIAGLTGVVLLVALGIFLPMWDMARIMK
jgi:type II secretory pathway component PulF